MGDIAIPGGPGNGGGSDECTATLDYVLQGKTAITSDSGDEPGAGRMSVNSLLSFDAAAHSGRRVIAKWQNPRAAKGKPYSGVIIRCSPDGYPGKTGGIQIYKGAGNNTASGGQSQAYLDLPAINTAYYLSCFPYVTCSAGDLTGNVMNAAVRTSGRIDLTITGTQNYTIPEGYTKMDVFAVGGGGKGNNQVDEWEGGGGGGGGYTVTEKGIAVTGGEVLSAVVGASGNGSSVNRGGTRLAWAEGGQSGGSFGSGCRGGSGGGGGSSSSSRAGGNGGSDGSAGARGSDAGGQGQGTTTRAFGEPGGTLYAGGGGGGSRNQNTDSAGGDPGWGGAGGGGTGGCIIPAAAGGPNTGGGGGGGSGYDDTYTYRGAPGGSGIILIRLY